MEVTWLEASFLPPVIDDEQHFSIDVLVITKDNNMHIASLRTYENEEFNAEWIMKGPDGYNIDNVTHWSYLPKPPRKSQIMPITFKLPTL